MVDDYKGRLTLCNIAFDCVTASLGKRLLRNFFRTVSREWPAQGTHPVSLITAIADTLGMFVRSSRSLRIRRCSRIMTAKDLVNSNIDSAAKGWNVIDTVPREYVDELERGLDGVAINMLPKTKSFAWVTKTSAIDELKSSCGPELARKVCAKLGLLHAIYFGELQVIEVIYPARIFGRKRGRLAAPTFLEGAGSLVYRSQKENDGWGLTVDIENSGAGLPEAVHSPVPFTSAFSVKNLGRVDGVVANVRWLMLYRSAPRPWRHEDVELLESYL